MSTRFALVACIALAMPSAALANGRPPNTATINFKPGDDNFAAAGTTFGLVVTRDGGASWQWICEDAIGYGGMYDPDYVYAPDGTIFATTFGGLKANRDGCTFGDIALGLKFISRETMGPDGALYVTSVDATDAKIYKSVDNGQTFDAGTLPPGAQLNDWWQSIEVAPTSASRLYVSGYRLVPNAPKQHLLYRSDNGGASYVALPTADFTLQPNSTIEILQVSRTNPDVVYARVTLEDNSVGDGIYKSTDRGASWTRIFGKPDRISFLERANGHLVAATQQVDAAAGLGAFVSVNGGTSWQPLPNPPHIGCLAENAAGEVWACTQNYGVPGIPADGFGIMKAAGDLATWAGVVKYQDIQSPVTCADGTVQHDTCDVKLFCGLCMQLGCDPGRNCATEAVDGAPDAPDVKPPGKSGSCATAEGGSSFAASALLGILLARKRRRCSVNSTVSRIARSTSRSS